MAIKDIVQSFSSIINSVNFFEEYYQQQFFKFLEKKIDLAILFDERDLKATIQFMPENSDRLLLVFNGIGMPLGKLKQRGVIQFDRLMRQHNGGATIIYNMLSHHSNRLYLLNKHLESIFHGYVHTNFYGTPKNSRGFKPHSDSHDVLVLQLKGSKDWAFYEAKEQAQRIRKAYDNDEVVLTQRTRMEQGDLMYVPRGLLHAAKATNEVSWHLTIGITGYYWSDVLKEMIEQNVPLQRKLRKVVPKDLNEEEVKQKAQEILSGIDFELSLESAWEKFYHRFPNLGEYLDQVEVLDQSLLAQLNPKMRFYSEKEKATVEYKDEAIFLDLPYREKPMQLHSRLKKSVEQIFNCSSFAPEEIMDISEEEEQLLLVYYLWNNGFISPIKND